MTRLVAVLAVCCVVCGCGDGYARRNVRVMEWSTTHPKYTITVTWDCDSLPDTLKIAVPR